MGSSASCLRAQRASCMALVALLGMRCVAVAAGADPLLMPPGLYRINSEVKFIGANGGFTMEGSTDGASGVVVTRRRTAMSDTGDEYSEIEPEVRCVHANPGGLPPLPANCKHQGTKRVGAEAIHTAVCPSGTTTMTVRRLDKNRWESRGEQSITSSIAAPNLDYLRPVLKHEIKHGKTALARLKAKQQLAELPALQAEVTNQHADTLAMMIKSFNEETDPKAKKALAATIADMQGAKPMKASTRFVWTRIAESCPVGQSGQPSLQP